MKVLTLGDPHAKLNSLEEIRLLANAAVSIAEEEKVDLIVVQGDLHDSMERAHLLVYNACVDFLAQLAKAKPTVLVIGNHDAVNNSIFLTEDHFFKAMKYWDSGKGVKLRVVDKATVIGPFVFCPYVPPGRFVEALDTIGRDTWLKAKAIFCHQEFKGAKMGAKESEQGDEWDPAWPPVISGHIHETQSLFGGRVAYVGTPYTTSFGEKDKKYIHVFDFGKSPVETKWIESPLPRKITIETTVAEFDSVELPENATVRVVVDGTAAELTALKKTKRYSELAARCKVICQPNDSDQQIESIKRQSYIDLLKDACTKESDEVRKTFEEVARL